MRGYPLIQAPSRVGRTDRHPAGAYVSRGITAPGRTAAAALAALTLVGCAVRTAPVASIEPAALTRWDPALYSDQAYDPRWWRQLDDPVLDQLQTAALTANHDVRTAVARLDQARAVFDEDSRDRFPAVTAGVFADARDQAVPGFTDDPVRITTYRAGLDASWEVDLFGRVRSAIRAAASTAESLDAALDAVRVSVAAEVAYNYFELRGLQRQMAVLERSLVNQRESLRLTIVRRDAGIGEEQDVASATARVSAVEAAVPPLRTAMAAREHRLAVLTGVRPGLLTVNLAPRPYPAIAKALPLGSPANVLARRPDVRAVERQLAAATAREGVASADLYPRVSISGVLGLLAGRGSVFGSSDSLAWAVTPALQWAAFDLGSAKARLRGARAATQEALANYERTMLLAIEETETALVSYREQQARLVKLSDQARESARAADIARVRYREGLADFLQLLDAERTQLQAEDGVAQAEVGVFTSLVDLYRAVGGIQEP
jgi:multidrug efflux system outer membrane protein